MAEPKQNAPRVPNLFSELSKGILGLLIVAAAWYLLISALILIKPLMDYAGIIKGIRFWGLILLFGLAGIGMFEDIKKSLNAAKARKVNEKVAEALSKITNDRPDQNIAEISAEEVASSLKDTKLNEEQIVRLVEQRKQKLLVDPEYIPEEVSSLIVEYLQPLPRNAKRLLNQFRVNLLIAQETNLLSSDPKVTGKQIGKWLVLTERWPQLGRSLSAAPEKMKILEEQSTNDAPPKSDPPQQDPFTESVKLLAPPYLGDEDLRRFVRSAPALAIVASRLVYYSTSEPTSPAAAKLSS